MAKHYDYALDATIKNYKGLYFGSKLIGLASYGDAETIDKDGILLSDILSHPQYRHFGFGTAFVTQLCNQFIEDDIYVNLLDPCLEAFYEPIGFVPSDIDEIFVKPATGLVF